MPLAREIRRPRGPGPEPPFFLSWISGKGKNGKRPTGRPTTRRSTTSRTPWPSRPCRRGVSGAPLVEAHTDPDLEENAETLSAVDGLLGRRVLSRSPPRSWSATHRISATGRWWRSSGDRLDARAPVRPRAGGAPNARRGPSRRPGAPRQPHAPVGERRQRLADEPGHDGRLRQFLREAGHRHQGRAGGGPGGGLGLPAARGRRRRRRTRRWRTLRDPLRRRRPAARGRVLVGHHVRRARVPVANELDRHALGEP